MTFMLAMRRRSTLDWTQTVMNGGGATVNYSGKTYSLPYDEAAKIQSKLTINCESPHLKSKMFLIKWL